MTKVIQSSYPGLREKPVPFLEVPPSGLRPDAQIPLIVFLHGCYREPLDLKTVLHLTEGPMRAIAAAVRFLGEPALVVGPSGLGNTRFEGTGARDVWKVIQFSCARWPVDPDRISLLGVSMGGYGALRMAAEAPDRFASVGTIGAYLDPERWPFPSSRHTDSWETPYLEASDLFHRLENFGNCRIVARHAAFDLGIAGGVPVSEARKLRRICESTSVPLNYAEWDRVEHDRIENAELQEMVAALLAERRTSEPRRVRWTGHWGPESSSYFVTDITETDPRRPSRVDITVEHDCFSIETQNTSSLALETGNKARRIHIDGSWISLSEHPERIRLLHGRSGWRAGGQPAKRVNWIREVLNREIAFVIPSEGLEARTLEMLREIARAERRRLLETGGGLRSGPYRRGYLIANLPILTDKEYLLSGWGGNAILYGPPSGNLAINAHAAGTWLASTWNARGRAPSSTCLRICLPGQNERVVVANIGENPWHLAGGFNLDYGRLPGFVSFNRSALLTWGFADSKGLRFAYSGAGKPVNVS